MQRWLPILAVLLLLAPRLVNAEGQAIQWARVYHDDQVHEPDASGTTGVRILSWPFCPSYQDRCGEYAWVTLGVSLDAYSARRNGAHASIKEIIETSYEDMAPLARALEQLFEEKGITSLAQRLGYVQGMVQAVQYAKDSSTGFTEYPKYAVEFLVDEQGDCDDAAVAASALMRQLGYETWYVLWRAASGREGHISTAVTRSGALAQVQPPSGSRLVTVPSTGQQLLHVDATGVIGGCTGRCTALGWNEWHSNSPPMRESVVVKADDPSLDAVLGISAWRNDGTAFPDRKHRDRRPGASEQQGEEDLDQPPEDRVSLQDDDGPIPGWEDATLRRLRFLGEDEESARSYLELRRPDPETEATWLLVSVAAIAGLFIALAAAWRGRQRRLALAAKARARRKSEEF
jgi:predicted transglutaminase-like cysteine proteinase